MLYLNLLGLCYSYIQLSIISKYPLVLKKHRYILYTKVKVKGKNFVLRKYVNFETNKICKLGYLFLLSDLIINDLFLIDLSLNTISASKSNFNYFVFCYPISEVKL